MILCKLYNTVWKDKYKYALINYANKFFSYKSKDTNIL